MGFFWLVSHNPANVYAPFNYIPNAASIGADTAVLGSDANLADEALKNSIVATGTKLILTVGFNCTSLASAVDFANQLDAIHSAVTSGTNVLSSVIGIEMGGEELFARVLTTSFPGNCPVITAETGYVAKNNKLRDLIAARITQTTCPTCRFPGRKAIVTDFWWLEDTTNPYYRPAPSNADVLGVQTYYHGNLHLCDAATYNNWLYQDVGYRLHGVMSTPAYSTKQFMVHAHSFRHPNQALWGNFPASCQIQWQYDLAIYLQTLFANRIWSMNWFMAAPNVQHGSDPFHLVEGIGHANNSTQLNTLVNIIATNNANR